jgi:hypothetical protein
VIQLEDRRTMRELALQDAGNVLEKIMIFEKLKDSVSAMVLEQVMIQSLNLEEEEIQSKLMHILDTCRPTWYIDSVFSFR